MAIPGRDTWLALQWADALLARLAEGDCGPPKRIISDRDPKFVAQMWKEIFKQQSTELRYTTAYHPQADGQSDRLNQTIELYLRMSQPYQLTHTIVKQSLEILTLGKTVRSGQLSLSIKGDN
ncbi:hypothetical protein CNMCM8980_003254 [Aspergillus fumigatiaffinis]|jgi:hypothetical protein|uniref:Integrase catalytic domain-containing protein n=1 Tax=Aspergillus fumigatiaffinis TaxID=340414 RepID=A0A8H4GX14_9EURO|nr:hypothetical protein CNMCM6805_000719 [Aspergillus fumigatiaffinis]KAF4235562.1 hypothetical protein CNMCM8980_003254 [Aspergillus fumigatiaffinis]